MKEKILVSSCLLGKACRYDATDKFSEKVAALKEKYEVIEVCPEELGGLSTPRQPSEIIDDKVFFKDGTDTTEAFHNGAQKVMKMITDKDIKFAVLKEASPSCGVNLIYDGTFSGNKIKGVGVTAQYLKEAGIKVISDEDLY